MGQRWTRLGPDHYGKSPQITGKFPLTAAVNEW
jgi:hypothetical protein